MDYGFGRLPSRTLRWVLPAIAFISFAAPAFADGTQYFINNQPGSHCINFGPHTIAQPWCSFAPMNQVHLLSPGDQILLARGDTWNEQLTLAGSGTANQPITLGAYGTGANPKILRNQATDDICVLLTNVGNWNIQHLEVGNASVGILLHYTSLLHAGIAIDDIYAHDNKGLWSGYSREFPVSGGTIDPFAASLNINLSAGILFNISSNFTFDSSQFVLKGISVSNIRGSHNLDSVAFDAEVPTTDGEDGHNAFQNVILNGLILTDDDGHAASEYQAAGLGCSDSIRLLGMTNVTMLDSVLYDEAACHTAWGTAAVLIGRVQNLTLTNNIVFGVPATGSPDETGIDLEFSESQVNVFSNLFAENAGPGIEILNIHPSDHTIGVNLGDNSFLNNAIAKSAAASIWEDAGGSDDAIPTGFIQDSLYSEPEAPFFAGNNSDSITQHNNVSTSTIPNYAAEQFGSQQGVNNWRYMVQASSSAWIDMPFYAPSDYNGAWEVSPAQYVSAFALAPASSGPRSSAGGVARAWVAPRDGSVDIRGRVLMSDGRGGAGVFAQINLVSGRNAIRLWPAAFGRGQFIAGTDQVGYASDLSNIAVRAGDIIRFDVTANGQNLYDTVSWTPSVAYVSAPLPKIATTPHGTTRAPDPPHPMAPKVSKAFIANELMVSSETQSPASLDRATRAPR